MSLYLSVSFVVLISLPPSGPCTCMSVYMSSILALNHIFQHFVFLSLCIWLSLLHSLSPEFSFWSIYSTVLINSLVRRRKWIGSVFLGEGRVNIALKPLFRWLTPKLICINIDRVRLLFIVVGGTSNPPLLQTNSHWTHNSLHNSLRYTGLFWTGQP